MRWVALAILLLSIPVFAALLGRDNTRRDLGVLLIGVLAFCVGHLAPSASVYGWPVWQGISKGIMLSLMDSVAIALLITRPPGRYRIPFLPLILLYLMTVLVSLVPAFNKVATLFTVVQLLQMIVLYVAAASELHRKSAIRSLLIGLSLGLIIQASYVARQKLGGMVQAPGTMAHQNILGLMVELSIFPLIAAVMEGERNKLVYGGILAGLICIAGSGSRGTMGFSALAMMLLIGVSLIRRSTGRKWQIVGLGVLGAALIVPLGIATLRDRFGGGSFDTEETSRLALESSAKSMASDYPLGVGANNFVTINNVGGYLRRTGELQLEATSARPVHNAYLLARAETGWAGQIALVLLIGGLTTAGVVTAFRYRKVPLAGVTLGSAAAFTAAALHSNFEYGLHLGDIQRLLFLNAALIAGVQAVGLSGIARQRRMERAQRSARAQASG